LAVVDSLNPATIAGGIYMTTVRRPVIAIKSHIVGAFLTYLTGGLAVSLGPARLASSLL